MKKKTILLTLLAVASFSASAYDESDFSSGVFVLNEDWYGHQNSTLNMWYPDDDDPFTSPVRYHVFQYANTGMQLGCTAQYAQIFGGRIYIMAKQFQDPGSTVAGGRLTIVNADDLKCIHQAKVINPKGVAEELGNTQTGTVSGSALGDGRACCGVTPDKVYLGTSNGVYILDTKSFKIEGPIAGTENELATSTDNNIDGQGPLYQNQIGIMIRTQDYVFAIKQDEGILCIDPVSDKVVSVIEGCFSTMVQAADGSIWAGMNLADPDKTNEFGVPLNHYPYGNNGSAWNGQGLLRIDPYTLETRQVDLKIGGVPQSWYAWTAGKLTASAKRNVLYFTYTDPSLGQGSWFSECKLYRYDIDTEQTDLIYDSSNDGLWFYSSSLRVSPVDDKLYCHFYVGASIANQDWVYIRFLDNGSSIESDAEWKLIKNYWYPAMFLFPDNELPEVSESMPKTVSLSDGAVTIDLADKVTDKDTPQVSIVKRILSNSNPSAVEAKIVRGKLELKSVGSGSADVIVQFDSNGMTVEHTVSVTTSSAIGSVAADVQSGKVTVYNLHGVELCQSVGTDEEAVANLPAGVYLLRRGNVTSKMIKH